MSPEAAKAKKLLEGIRVADFTLVITGPTVTRMMADAGAEVIKIELPAGVGILGVSNWAERLFKAAWNTQCA